MFFLVLWTKGIIYKCDDGLNVDQVAKDPRPRGWKEENQWLILHPTFITCEEDRRSSSL